MFKLILISLALIIEMIVYYYIGRGYELFFIFLTMIIIAFIGTDDNKTKKQIINENNGN